MEDKAELLDTWEEEDRPRVVQPSQSYNCKFAALLIGVFVCGLIVGKQFGSASYQDLRVLVEELRHLSHRDAHSSSHDIAPSKPTQQTHSPNEEFPSDVASKCATEKVIEEYLLDNSSHAECDFLKPLMHKNEMELAMRMTKNKKTYVEWGSGGSSNTFAILAERSFTIEHATQWCKRVETQPVFAARVKQGKSKYVCVDTGLPLREYGYPDCGALSQENCYEHFRPYLTAIDDSLRFFGTTAVDVVFIDGRFRSACARKALQYLHQDSVLMFHDDGRGYSGSVSEYFTVVDQAGTLTVMKPKPEFLGRDDLWLDFRSGRISK